MYTDKSNPREKGFIPAHSAKVSSIIVRKAGWRSPKELVTFHPQSGGKGWIFCSAQFFSLKMCIY